MTTTQTQPKPIQITERDKRRLEAMIDEIKRRGRKEESLDSLVAELERASVVHSEAIPRNFVTMGSLVSIIDQETSERLQYRLVYPDQADASTNQISILSPVGAGMLGYQVGDEFEWPVPSGIRKFVIAKVDYQPEAANTYRL
ncbi:nucleoside diphosphate kinase regulator [Verrucomicrobiaceae bacterium 227]